jgi:hypothetical protein
MRKKCAGAENAPCTKLFKQCGEHVENMRNNCEQHAEKVCGDRKCARYAQHMRNISATYAENMRCWTNTKNIRICTTYAQHMRNTCEMLENYRIHLAIRLAMSNAFFSQIFNIIVCMFRNSHYFHIFVATPKHRFSHVFHKLNMLLDYRHSIVSGIYEYN